MVVDKRHPVAQTNGGFGITAFMQELMCYVGQDRVFKDASQLLKRLTGVEVNAKQIERVCHFYGQQLESTLYGKDYVSPLAVEIQKQKATDTSKRYYILMDGSMVFTREEQWKEIKLARIFREDKRVDRTGVNRNMITSSQFVTHLGGHEQFWDKLDCHIAEIPSKRRVFLCDGAGWIWNRVEDSYPESIQIVDFFHAKEHLSDAVDPIFGQQKAQKHAWLVLQENLLFKDDVRAVIKELSWLAKKYPKQAGVLKKEVNYFTTHTSRMKYGSFRKQNLLIGSGPIESANRQVIQQRLKLSGQRWTKSGLQYMANLRSTYLSGQWKLVQELINNPQ